MEISTRTQVNGVKVSKVLIAGNIQEKTKFIDLNKKKYGKKDSFLLSKDTEESFGIGLKM